MHLLHSVGILVWSFGGYPYSSFYIALIKIFYLCVDSWIGGVVGGVASLPSSAQVSKQLLQVFDASFTVIKAVWSRFSGLKNGECYTTNTDLITGMLFSFLDFYST